MPLSAFTPPPPPHPPPAPSTSPRPPPSSRPPRSSPPHPTPPTRRSKLPPPPSNPLPQTQLSALHALANSSGALGRGVRATLRAFHRRASFLLPHHPSEAPIYVEIGPAYVLASAPSSDRATRYAVEQRAWPSLRALIAWQEVTTTEARQRLHPTPLRHLTPASRFGRHLFLAPSALHCLLVVAESMQLAPHAETSLLFEAYVQLKRPPLPGLRTVAARCPRKHSHSHSDRKPSLMLWMNQDGRTGGAMCPVCLHCAPSSAKALTWRVHYLPNDVAALYTPFSRVPSADTLQKQIHEYRRTESYSQPAVDPVSSSPAHTRTANTPVGGCVLTDPTRLKQVGNVIAMAYVTASLRISSELHSMHSSTVDAARLRTVGNMARQSCPMQVLLSSQRRSKGPTCSKRVEEIAWFARQAAGLEEQSDGEFQKDDPLDSEQWLPTPLVSVSAMKPSGWRDVSVKGRSVSVPASWEASVQAWVLFDLDDLGALDDAVVTKAANNIVKAVRRNQELTGRCLVLQTGPSGIHVWAELREVRDNPRVWFKDDETRAWYIKLGNKLLLASHRGGVKGGKVDMSSCSAGRFARRPGWRLLEDGTLFHSHVVIYVPGAVRTRKPRLE